MNLKQVILGNHLEKWFWFFGIIVFGFIIKNLISAVFSRLVYIFVKKDSHGITAQEFKAIFARPLGFLLSIIILSLAFDEIEISKSLRILPLGKMRVSVFIDKIIDTLFIVSVTWIAIRIVTFVAKIRENEALENDDLKKFQLVPFVKDLLVFALTFVSFFIIIGFVFKQDVISLITGLGIGGVALALAARETLENLFASFTIFIDQPFKLGDSLEVGTLQIGDVEKIGFRSTRLRVADGSLMVIPNKLMISQNLVNHTEREYRRVKYILKISPRQNQENLEVFKTKTLKLLNEHKDVDSTKHLPYIQIDKIGEYFIDLLVVYYVNEPDFRAFKFIQNSIDSQMLRLLEDLQIELYNPVSDKK